MQEAPVFLLYQLLSDASVRPDTAGYPKRAIITPVSRTVTISDCSSPSR
jgi:hypothetical protein